MPKTRISFCAAFVLTLAACTMVQNPALVVEAPTDRLAVAQNTTASIVAPVSNPEEVRPSRALLNQVPSKSLGISDLGVIAKSATKSPGTAKKYAGETLSGQAKFIKAPKGNPNAVVADVRVAGLGEVSLWCRNVLGGAPAGRVVSFEGTLSGSVYTSEDFSHDVTMKDCRFQ